MTMTKQKDILYVRETQTVNTNTGELTLEHTITKRKVGSEPNFIKLYLQDILYLNDLPKTSNGVLYLLLKKMNYENKVEITAGGKREMAKMLNIQENTVKQTIYNFQKKNILKKVDTGLYLLNPFYFGKGEWKDIQKIRLELDYRFYPANNTGDSMINAVEVEKTVGNKENECDTSEEDTN